MNTVIHKRVTRYIQVASGKLYTKMVKNCFKGQETPPKYPTKNLDKATITKSNEKTNWCNPDEFPASVTSEATSTQGNKLASSSMFPCH